MPFTGRAYRIVSTRSRSRSSFSFPSHPATHNAQDVLAGTLQVPRSPPHSTPTRHPSTSLPHRNARVQEHNATKSKELTGAYSSSTVDRHRPTDSLHPLSQSHAQRRLSTSPAGRINLCNVALGPCYSTEGDTTELRRRVPSLSACSCRGRWLRLAVVLHVSAHELVGS